MNAQQSTESALETLRDELVEAHIEHGRVFVGIGLARAVLRSRWFRARLAEAWYAGYEKGNLDGYFGTSDERARSPYVDLDPHREPSTPPGRPSSE